MPESTRVYFVAAPLVARSGVYRSAHELVREGRSRGLDWHLLLGVSARAPGDTPLNNPAWIQEFIHEPESIIGIVKLVHKLKSRIEKSGTPTVVSLIPQTDLALGLLPYRWIAYVRGLPWPERGESTRAKAVIWRALERIALARAEGVWCTTPVLRSALKLRSTVQLVPAGIAPVPRTWDGRGPRNKVVWAGRYNTDKNPGLFMTLMSGSPLKGVMYGTGALQQELDRQSPSNVEIAGWSRSQDLWKDALAYVGTSYREAFGRSAVEAAMNGIPLIIADTFGAATLLITQERLRELFVLPLNDLTRWKAAIDLLKHDEELRILLSDHVSDNARRLTIAASVDAISHALRRGESYPK